MKLEVLQFLRSKKYKNKRSQLEKTIPEIIQEVISELQISESAFLEETSETLEDVIEEFYENI